MRPNVAFKSKGILNLRISGLESKILVKLRACACACVEGGGGGCVSIPFFFVNLLCSRSTLTPQSWIIMTQKIWFTKNADDNVQDLYPPRCAQKHQISI